ncbi:hypothetical protein B0H19DRAFT_1183637 [Mycena capillaripes]|nr:hypothetical protein B0H19DRAFT_1183637 [Mycena capillaripes]
MYVPPESTSPTQPAHSAHTPVLLRIESISMATSLLAPFRPYALNPRLERRAHTATSRVHLSLHVVGMPLSIYALRPVFLHAAVPLLPCLRPSSLTPPPFSPMLAPDIFHLHTYFGCRTLRHSLFVCSTPGLSPCRSFLPFPPKLFPLTSSPGIRRILDSTPRHNVSTPPNAVLWNGYTGCSVYTTKRPGLLQRSMAVPHSTRLKRTLCAVLSPYPIAQRRNALVSALPRFISPSEATSSKPSAAVGSGSPRSSSSIDSAATRFRRHVRHSSRRAQLRKFGPVWEHTGLL